MTEECMFTHIRIHGREWSARDIRMFATGLRDMHDADQQDHGYNRCEHCGYGRHPCDVYDLASMVLALIGDEAKEMR